MAIINYPDRIYKKIVPAIDRELAKRNPITVSGAQDITVDDLDIVVSPESDWQIDSIAFVFSNANARNFSASVKNGRKVVTNYNDYLWIEVRGVLPQRIILDSGFYNGTELSTELQTQLDANTSFIAAGITFTVVYDSTTGLFTITPSSSTIRYLDINTGQTIPNRQSIAGHLVGLNTTTSFAANVSSDLALLGLDTVVPIINETASSATSLYHDDLHILSIDQALILGSNSGVAVTIDYTIVYEELV